MAIAADVKDMLSIKMKHRHDSFTDQFTRILLMKLMLLGAFFIGMNWFSDSINCIMPGTNDISDKFASPACWINGLYIYEDIQAHEGHLGYYGIPRNLRDDGITEDGEPCSTVATQSRKVIKGCTARPRTFYLQYQYMVFLVAILAGVYHLPYLVYKICNSDIISLRGNVKSDETAESIHDSYFNRKHNPASKMRLRVLATIAVKILYIVVNVLAFMFLNEVLNGNYRTFGSNWIDWSKLGNAISFDYMGARDSPKPANVLLPSFAICEVFEEAADIKHTVMNSHKFVCELSNFILYQYILIVIWFAQVIGVVVSVIGLIMCIIDIVMVLCFVKPTSDAQKNIYNRLSIRECEYLEYVRKKNLALYGKLIDLLEADGELPMVGKDASAPSFSLLKKKKKKEAEAY